MTDNLAKIDWEAVSAWVEAFPGGGCALGVLFALGLLVGIMIGRQS